MMKLETPFVTDHELIIVFAHVTGPRRTTLGRFVLDTGAAATTVVPELIDTIGYSPRDGFRRTRVHSAIGEESGYMLRLAEFTVLGFAMSNLAVNVFDLGHGNIHGLLGMNFLCQFNYEVRSSERRLLVEKI